jgi:hypothetical protein
MRLIHAVTALALAIAANAQALFVAQNDNLSYGNYAVGWPSSVIAFRFTAPSGVPLDAAQVFTGNQSAAQHSVEIRTVHANTGLPDQLVGQPGTWTVEHARCWQGARFGQAAQLQANTDYYLVWRVAGMFPQHSVCADNLPGAVQSEVRYSDGNTWHAVATASAKFRLFLPYQAGSFATFGTGKPGIYGAPTLGATGWPAVGSSFDVWLDNAARVASTAPPNAILLIGWPIPAGNTFPLGTLYSTGDALLFQRTWLHTNPTAGACSFTFAVPNVPAAFGLTLAFQWAVFDNAAAGGLSHTGGITALLQ